MSLSFQSIDKCQTKKDRLSVDGLPSLAALAWTLLQTQLLCANAIPCHYHNAAGNTVTEIPTFLQRERQLWWRKTALVQSPKCTPTMECDNHKNVGSNATKRQSLWALWSNYIDLAPTLTCAKTDCSGKHFVVYAIHKYRLPYLTSMSCTGQRFSLTTVRAW